MGSGPQQVSGAVVHTRCYVCVRQLPAWAQMSFEGFPVLNASACMLKIMIAMGLEHVQLMVMHTFLPLKELKGFLEAHLGPCVLCHFIFHLDKHNSSPKCQPYLGGK